MALVVIFVEVLLLLLLLNVLKHLYVLAGAKSATKPKLLSSVGSVRM